MGVTAHTRLLRSLPGFKDFGDVDFCGVRVGGQPNPMFRTFVPTSSPSFAYWVAVDIMGALMIAWTVRLAYGMPLMLYTHSTGQVLDGMTWTMFKPSWPAVLPTPETFLDSLTATKSEIVYCVPAFIEASTALISPWRH